MYVLTTRARIASRRGEHERAVALANEAVAVVDAAEYAMQLTSHPFQVRGYKRAAVKVVDVFGNESTFVTSLT